MVLLQQMIALFLMMLVGYVCAKMGVLDAMASKKISWLVVNVGNPAMILAAGMDNEIPVAPEKLMLVVVLAVIIYAALIVISVFLPGLLCVEEQNAGIYRVMLIFSNIGFMGLPLISVLYGGESLLYTSIFFFPFNFLIYTYGIRAMKKDGKTKEKIRWPGICNIGVITSVIALILYVGKICLPDFAVTTAQNLSNITAPLSMLVIGASFLDFKIRDLFTDTRLLLFSGIKMLLIPLAGTWIIKQFVDDPMIVGVCMVMIATPVGSMTAMLAQQYDGNYDLAARGVALTAILAVVTMPVVSVLMGA